SFVQLHARDGHLGAEQYPLDSGGNLYALNDRGDANPPGTLAFVATASSFKDSSLPAAPQPGADTGYHKQSNASEDDWQDLVELTRALSTVETPDFTAEDDLNFIHQVSQVINVNEWLRHMAVTALLRNEEGGYATGRGDDYSIYRGQYDTRFELVPHDLDTIMDIQGAAGWGGTSSPIILKRQGTDWQGFRVIEHPAFAPIFYGHLIDLMDTIYNPEHLDPIIDRLLGNGAEWVPTELIDRFKDFVSGRETWVRDQIDRNVGGIPNPVSPNDLSQLPAEYQSLALQQRYLRISEIMFNPRGEELEFIELVNMGDSPLDLTGVHFKGGMLFGFNTGAPIVSAGGQTPETILDPGQRVLVVKNRAAFLAQYDPDGSKNLAANIAGEFWNGSLSNAGERILLEGRLGEPILDFSYRDHWYDQTDGGGFSLVLRDDVDQDTPRSVWGEKSTWRASGRAGGSPGEADRGLAPDAIRINELLSHTDQAAGGDWVELHNTTDAAIDIGGWYLSDSGNNLRKFRIPGGTVIAGGGFATFDQFGAGGFGDNAADPLTNPLGNPGAFGLSELGDTLRLSSVDPDDIRENIDAVHVMPNGNIVLSTTGTAMLGSNAFSFRNGDLVEYNPTSGAVTLLFSELSFIGESENIDAVSVLANGHLVFSTGGPARLPAAGGTTLSFGNGDLVAWDPLNQTATLVFSESLFDAESSSALPNENIDALHVLGNNEFIISTSGPASIGGRSFDDGDLIRVVTSAGGTVLQSVSLYFSESLFAVEPLGVVPTENIDAVFVDEAQGPNGTLVLSAASSFSLSLPLSTPLVIFDDGDLVEITLGDGADLASVLPSFGIGASATRLLAEDPADGSITFYGEAAGYRAAAEFGAAQGEVSFGIHETSGSSNDFVAQQEITKGFANTLPSVGPIVINEIMYNPRQQSADGVEFIELLNITGNDVHLWDPAFPTHTWTIGGALNFEFPVGTTIPANGYLLLVSDDATFAVDNNVSAGVQIFEYSGRLDNAGETIRLNKPGEPEPIGGFVPTILVDRVSYDDTPPWPVAADGGGPSMERIEAAQYGNDASNWRVGIDGGTPGPRPSQSRLLADLTGDGFVDFGDLTLLLAHWNQNVPAGEGNLVDPAGTPVNFEDLTVLLAAWTGPGAGGSPVGRWLA
ncbi:MAG: lamin tail domain-containing protein, partial [Planctomycetes bacterium]|nr:lamin tail domain-containing protein [Planctomycetota bacterium]